MQENRSPSQKRSNQKSEQRVGVAEHAHMANKQLLLVASVILPNALGQLNRGYNQLYISLASSRTSQFLCPFPHTYANEHIVACQACHFDFWPYACSLAANFWSCSQAKVGATDLVRVGAPTTGVSSLLCWDSNVTASQNPCNHRKA